VTLVAVHPVFLVADVASTIRWYRDVLVFAERE
jgi:catechol 2,3-dioxygenase-like lactoylglutathione lyase family enzyme